MNAISSIKSISPRKPRRISTALAAIVIGIAAPASAATLTTITGPARVVDGDTVIVGNISIRLKGVDASELGTDLGEAAKTVMQTIVGTSNLTCSMTGEKTWRREVGYCVTADGTDINRAIIEQGAALACPRYDTRYLPFEQAARRAGAGDLLHRAGAVMTRKQASPPTIRARIGSIIAGPRLEKLDRAKITRYRQALRQGDTFPAIAVIRHGSGCYEIFDGFHRYHAHRLEGHKTIAVWMMVS